MSKNSYKLSFTLKSLTFLLVISLIFLVQFYLYKQEKIKNIPSKQTQNINLQVKEKPQNFITYLKQQYQDIANNQHPKKVSTSSQKINFNILKTHTGKVIKIADGDTFTLNNLNKRIRIWGIDAPEYSQVNYDKATNLLYKLIWHKVVTCKLVTKDTYNRQVARCFIGKTTLAENDISLLMINSGLVKEYCHYSKNFYKHCFSKTK